MHRKMLAQILFSLPLLGACDPSVLNAGGAQNDNSSYCTDSDGDTSLKQNREDVCGLVNNERADRGQEPLTLDSSLNAVAQAHAEDMVNRGFFDHTNPDGDTPFDRLISAGITYTSAGENIAAGQQTPAAVMESWMNSAGHKANILSNGYSKIGIGYYQNYWVQIFTN